MKKMLEKAKETVRDVTGTVRNNKAKYVVLLVTAIIVPSGIVIGPAMIVRELKKDKKKAKKSAANEEDSGKPDSSFSFPQIHAKIKLRYRLQATRFTIKTYLAKLMEQSGG